MSVSKVSVAIRVVPKSQDALSTSQRVGKQRTPSCSRPGCLSLRSN